MKIKFTLAMIALVAFAGVKSFAQAEESYVKILPTSVPGVIKVHYALETNEPLTVKFFSDNDVLASDRIKGGPFPNGVSKRYNVRNIQNKDYWVEVGSSRMTVTYHIIPSTDKRTFTPYLEKTIYNNQVLVRANN
jgi:hypothetical protein